MRIGVDVRWLEDPKRTGVARYIVNLLREFALLAPENEYVLYARVDLQDDFLNQPCFTHRKIGDEPPRDSVVWENAALPLAVRHDALQALLSPAYTAPLICPVKRIVAIHDISYQTHPEWYSRKDRFFLKTCSRISARKAEAVITISEFSKREMVEHYGIPPEKITVIPLAADPAFRPIDEERIEEVRMKYGISKEYVVHVGAMFVRRNLPVLLRAFGKIADRVEHELVIVGPNRTLPYQDIKGLARELGIEKRVVFIDYADDDEMAPLFSGATASVYLSTYEGFGFPALESLACRTPVVASNMSSVPEVVGNAGVLVNPLDVDEVAAELLKVLTDTELRSRLEDKALVQAASFSPRRTAEETLALLNRLVGQ